MSDYQFKYLIDACFYAFLFATGCGLIGFVIWYLGKFSHEEIMDYQKREEE